MKKFATLLIAATAIIGTSTSFVTYADSHGEDTVMEKAFKGVKKGYKGARKADNQEELVTSLEAMLESAKTAQAETPKNPDKPAKGETISRKALFDQGMEKFVAKIESTLALAKSGADEAEIDQALEELDDMKKYAHKRLKKKKK